MTAQTPLYKDTSQPLTIRVDDLVSRMTLEEKISQINLVSAVSKAAFCIKKICEFLIIS